jgi:hypothetical protein
LVADVTEFIAARAARAVRAVRAVRAARAVRAVRAVRAFIQCRTKLFRCLLGLPRVVVFVIPTVVFICVGHSGDKILNFVGGVKDYSSLFLMARFAADEGLIPSSYHCI